VGGHSSPFSEVGLGAAAGVATATGVLTTDGVDKTLDCATDVMDAGEVPANTLPTPVATEAGLIVTTL